MAIPNRCCMHIGRWRRRRGKGESLSRDYPLVLFPQYARTSRRHPALRKITKLTIGGMGQIGLLAKASLVVRNAYIELFMLPLRFAQMTASLSRGPNCRWFPCFQSITHRIGFGGIVGT